MDGETEDDEDEEEAEELGGSGSGTARGGSDLGNGSGLGIGSVRLGRRRLVDWAEAAAEVEPMGRSGVGVGLIMVLVF